MISSNNRNSIKRCFANEMRIRDPTSNDFMCPLCPITMQCSNPSPSPLLFTEPNGSAKQRLAWNSWQRLAITRHSRDYTEPLLIQAAGRTLGHKDRPEPRHQQPTCTTDKQQRQHCRNLFLTGSTPESRNSVAWDRSPGRVDPRSRTCPPRIACPR